MYRMALHPGIHFAMLVSPRIPVVDALAVAVSAVDYTAADAVDVAVVAGFVDLMMMIFEHFAPFDYS